jgi:hypothetical protein
LERERPLVTARAARDGEVSRAFVNRGESGRRDGGLDGGDDQVKQ